MKTIVLSAIIAMTSIVSSLAANNGLVYNTQMEGNRMTGKTVYKEDAARLLHHYLQYNYAYDEQGHMVRKEALRWDEAKGNYRPHYALTTTYEGDTTTVVYALWDERTESYSRIRQKTVYTAVPGGMDYRAYNYDSRCGEWMLTLAANDLALAGDTPLLAQNGK